MLTTKRIRGLPENFAEFKEEIALDLKHLYGDKAEAEYRAEAEKRVLASATHPQVDTLAVFEGKRAAGMLMAVTKGDVAHISFLHVLAEFENRGVEERLVEESVRTLRAGGVDGIISDFINFHPLREAEVYASLGFERIHRAIMGASLQNDGLCAEGPRVTRALSSAEKTEVATLIVNTYEDHAERRLHEEVRSTEGALEFVNQATTGGYGPATPEYCRVASPSGPIDGAIVGCKVAPDVGFILQLTVHPRCQTKGIGTRLVQELAETYKKDGLDRIALGVTLSNPAVGLYKRLGFEKWLELSAYVWWR